MADKKPSEIVLERTYNIPLRREYLKVQNWRRTEKAVTATREFLKRHLKAESIDNVKLGKELNEELWKHGLKNPPHHVKVTVTKDKSGMVRAELFGRKKREGAKEDKVKKVEEKKETKNGRGKEEAREKNEEAVSKREETTAEKKQPAPQKTKEITP